MATITLKGNTIQTVGTLPAVGSEAPFFCLVKTDLSEAGPADFAGKRMVLNIFPSLDTAVCAASVRRFNKEASSFDNTVVLCISADLPFAHKRFCEVEGLDDVISLSVFRSPAFGSDYGVSIADGPLRGLLSRAVVIVDADGRIAYTEQVPEIVEEPDYDAALAALA
ncbi:thiol peroxidase [Chlorobium phaeovibrioides]|uniref:Thiol peroxidase n=2 Tax=Chlorobium phaeovibrioides TaxID=1094 RepID=A0A3S0L054_CHLPH|nr:thiol peroxidase [Chlorobium phaeovibrioides]HCD37070.1 thiol peroxidase [Chlorobium sp.]KAA6232764.1 thiol peroxidase [Chlorobium phaeovibrioides]MWV54936.1 thiol peroxidase [Chlorobium phaeovibrioides]QEQ56822.1 thiol peroxidase [Chlorobium phaeovibrioides]RTY36329.1 thiol peroxidase [Chlorobium phaeovibrioides]